MAITYTAGTASSVTGGTALNINVPACAAGDLLLVHVGSAFFNVPPSSFSETMTPISTSDFLFKRVIDGTEGWGSGGTLVATMPDATGSYGRSLIVPADEWSGTLSEVISAPTDDSNTATSAAPNAPSVTGWSGEDWSVISFAVFGSGVARTWGTDPSGYTQLYEDTYFSGTYGGAAYYKSSTSASEDPPAMAASGSVTWYAHSVRVRGFDPGPAIETLTPADDATDVAIDANLVLVFDENVTEGTGNFVAYRQSDDAVLWTIPVGDAQVDITDDTVTINPTTNFAYETTYYVTAADGIVTDWDGLAADEWVFTTADTPPAPSIDALSPANSSHGNDPDADLVLTFDENVEIDEATGTIALKDRVTGATVESWTIDDADVDISGAVVTVTRSTTLSTAAGSGYYVELEGSPLKSTATDGAAADFTGRSTWSFSCFTPTSYQYVSRRFMVPVSE
jgi:hypothetical protein